MLKKCMVGVVAAGLAVLALVSQAKSAYVDGSGFIVMKNAAHKTQLYRIVNTSDQSIHVDVVAKPVGVQAGYASILDPKNASAFMYDGAKPPLSWQCQSAVNAASPLQKVACNTVLKVSVVRAKNLKQETSSYWLIENKPQAGFKDLLQATLTHNHLLNGH